MTKRPLKISNRRIENLSSLSRIEQVVLEHVSRYRLTTRVGWRGAWELRRFDDAAIAKVVRRLVRAGILRSRVLYGSIHAFELDGAGAELLSLPKERTNPFSDVATVRAYAQLLFATTGKRKYVLADHRLDSPRQAVPIESLSLPYKHICAWGFFFDPETPNLWSQLFLDRTLNTQPNRIAQRLRRTAIKLRNHPFWNGKIESGEFCLSVITPTAIRAVLIQMRFGKYDEHATLPLNILVAPGLLPLLNRHRHKGASS